MDACPPPEICILFVGVAGRRKTVPEPNGEEQMGVSYTKVGSKLTRVHMYEFARVHVGLLRYSLKAVALKSPKNWGGRGGLTGLI